MQGVGCPSGTNYFDERDTMLSNAGVSDATLLGVAGDTDAPTPARYRALRMLERRNGSFDADTVRWLVTDESEAVLVRAAALALLAGSEQPSLREEARLLAEGLGSHADKRLARLTNRYR